MKKYTLNVSGTHCASCKILIEDILSNQDSVEYARVNLKAETVDIEIKGDDNAETLAQALTEKIKSHGYALSTTKNNNTKNNPDVIWTAIPIGLTILALFFLLQKSGILNFSFGGQITPVTSLMVGLVASVSSCLAVVGGLVLSLSAKMSQDNISDTKTFTLFHISRLVSFAILGGVLGLIGKVIGINLTLTSILGLLAATVMLILGLNLVGVFAKNNFTLPSGIFNFFKKIEHKTFAPILIGLGTFFLPCGFTQSMQVVALSSGGFMSGLLIMSAFALGTLPMLALLSFGSTSFSQSKYATLFFKSAGVVVIGFGLFALLSSLAGLGIINPILNI